MLRLRATLDQALTSPALRVTFLYGVTGLGFALANVILARNLSKEQFALVVLAVTLVNLAYPFASLGLDGIVLRHRLQADLGLMLRCLKVAFPTAIGISIFGLFIYHLDEFLVAAIFVSVLAGALSYLASARFLSLERYVPSVVFSQGSNYFLLLAALLSWTPVMMSADGVLSVLALGHLSAAFLGWAWLLGEERVQEPLPAHYPWHERLSLAGTAAAANAMLQLDRLLIPRVIGLDDLALYGVVAAIVIAPFRTIQVGVNKSLLPRLRNAASATDRQRLLVREATVVGGVVATLSIAMWIAAPPVFDCLFQVKYTLTRSVLLASLSSGLVKVLSGFADAAVTALAGPRALGAWNLEGWIIVALSVLGGVAGAHWGLAGLILGVSAGSLIRFVLASYLVYPYFRPESRDPGAAH